MKNKTTFLLLLLLGSMPSLLARPMDGSEIDPSNNSSPRARAQTQARAQVLTRAHVRLAQMRPIQVQERGTHQVVFHNKAATQR